MLSRCPSCRAPQVLKVCVEVSRGMDYLHQRKIIHRDLKATNLLLDENGTVGPQPVHSYVHISSNACRGCPPVHLHMLAIPHVCIAWIVCSHKLRVHGIHARTHSAGIGWLTPPAVADTCIVRDRLAIWYRLPSWHMLVH